MQPAKKLAGTCFGNLVLALNVKNEELIDLNINYPLNLKKNMKKQVKKMILMAPLVLAGSAYAQTNYSAPASASSGASSTVYNTVIGVGSGVSTATGIENTILGGATGISLSTGNRNTCVGYESGQMTTGANNCYFGCGTSIANTTGSNNTALGTFAGSLINGSNNIFIGYNAGSQSAVTAVNNKLFIDISNTATPLIGGDFSARVATVNGSFGVGTTTPFAKFDVIGSNSSGVSANFANTAGYKTFFVTQSGAWGYNSLVKQNDNTIIWDNGTNGNGVTNGLVLAGWNAPGGVRIDATGATSVNCTNGITLSPFTVQKSGVNLLQVDPSGNVGANGNIVMNNNPGGSPVTSAQIYLKTYGGTASPDLNHGLGYFNNFNTTKNGVQTAVYVNGPVLYGWAGGALASMNAGSPTTSNIALQWNSTGQVFIGNQKQTTGSGNHANALLSVSGDVVIGSTGTANLFVTQSNWADFVFDKNYALMSLNEVESFYKENHHLPNVPTTKDIEENGNNIGQTEVVLLQKVEELTLYLVEQKKLAEQQQKEINELKALIKSNK